MPQWTPGSTGEHDDPDVAAARRAHGFHPLRVAKVVQETSDTRSFVLVAGLTPLPRTHWWQSALLVPPLIAGVTALAPHLPAALVGRLDYSRGGTAPKIAPVETT